MLYLVKIIEPVRGKSGALQIEAESPDAARRAAAAQFPAGGAWTITDVISAKDAAIDEDMLEDSTEAIIDRLDAITDELVAIRNTGILAAPRRTIADGMLLWVVVMAIISVLLTVLAALWMANLVTRAIADARNAPPTPAQVAK